MTTKEDSKRVGGARPEGNVIRLKPEAAAGTQRSDTPAEASDRDRRKAAHDLLRDCLPPLRVARACLQSEVADLVQDAQIDDVRGLMLQAWNSAARASTELSETFDVAPERTPANKKGAAIQFSLYDTMDVLTLALRAINGNDLPTGGQITSNPLRGALEVVIERLERLNDQMTAYRASCWKTGRARA